MIELTCSQCGKTLRVPDERAGKQGRCACGVMITIPSVPAPAAPPPPSGPPVQPAAAVRFSAGTTAVQRPAKGMAVCALVFGCVAIVFPPLGLVAIILGIVVLASRRQGKGMATVGLVLGLVLPVPTIMILLWAVQSAVRTGYVTQTLVQRKNLEDGAENYKMEHRGYYPGQQDRALFNTYTGSQILAAALYDFDISVAVPNEDTIIGKYASYRHEYLKKIDGKTNCLSDLFPPGKEKAFCYYPYRPSGTNRATKFLWTDNQDHTGGNANNLSGRVTDSRFGNSNDVHNEGRFLLIAPGVDRNYFTDDDIQNFNP